LTAPLPEGGTAVRRLLVLLALCATLAGCGGYAPAPIAPATPTSPATLVMPDEVNKNAAVAVDELHKLGFTNVDLGTVDGHRVVILPQNWTVKTQSAPPGTHLKSDTKIVLGCARNS
jgi:ABC-type uncharacterized transport system auxiliary subunit